MRALSLAAIAALSPAPLSAQVLVDWSFSSLNYSGLGKVPVVNPILPASASTHGPNLVVSDLIADKANPANSGLAWASPVANGGPGQANIRFFDGDPNFATGWHDGVSDNFLSFTITATTPGTLDIGRLSIRQWRDNIGAPEALRFKIAVDGGSEFAFAESELVPHHGHGIYDWFHFDGLIVGATTVVVRYMPVAAPGGFGSGNLHINGLRVEGPGGAGSVYCAPAVVNSRGLSAAISAGGSPSVANNDITLFASGLPIQQFGFFLNSQSQGFLPNPGGIPGILCLGSPIGRYNSTAQILNSGSRGAFLLELDLVNTPTPNGPVPVLAGQTWHFQCWYRDFTVGPTSNFTSAVSVGFQ